MRPLTYAEQAEIDALPIPNPARVRNLKAPHPVTRHLFNRPLPERAKLEALPRFARRVIEERARLAMVDPAGELDAVRPLGRVRARGIALELLDIAEDTLRRRNHRPNRPAGGTLDETAILGRIGADPDKKAGSVQCPAHEDRSPSLSWRITDAGRVLLKCHAGCTFDEIRRAAA